MTTNRDRAASFIYVYCADASGHDAEVRTLTTLLDEAEAEARGEAEREALRQALGRMTTCVACAGSRIVADADLERRREVLATPAAPPRARLDADRTATPKTRLVARVDVPDDGVRRAIAVPPATHIELEDGTTTALASPRVEEPEDDAAGDELQSVIDREMADLATELRQLRAVAEAARRLLSTLDAHATLSFGETEDALNEALAKLPKETP